MATRFLIDTSAVIKYLNGTLPTKALLFLDRIFVIERNISFISEIELQSWNAINSEDLIIYQFFVSNSTIYGIQDNIIQETIRIRKDFKIKLPDSLIAATAIENRMVLIADNDKDFKKVPQLKYINPNSILE